MMLPPSTQFEFPDPIPTLSVPKTSSTWCLHPFTLDDIGEGGSTGSTAALQAHRTAILETLKDEVLAFLVGSRIAIRVKRDEASLEIYGYAGSGGLASNDSTAESSHAIMGRLHPSPTRCTIPHSSDSGIPVSFSSTFKFGPGTVQAKEKCRDSYSFPAEVRWYDRIDQWITQESGPPEHTTDMKESYLLGRVVTPEHSKEAPTLIRSVSNICLGQVKCGVLDGEITSGTEGDDFILTFPVSLSIACEINEEIRRLPGRVDSRLVMFSI